MLQKTRYLLILLIILLVVACDRQTNTNKIIHDADVLLNTKPDSTLIILQKIVNPEQLADSTKANYWLVMGKAHFLENQSLSEDSLLMYALDYYRNTNNNNTRLNQAYQLAPLYLSWNNKTDVAIALLQEGIQVASNNKDTMQLKNLYEISAYIDQEYNYENMARAVKHLREYIELAPPDEDLSREYKSLGVVYGYLLQRDSCIWAFDMSLSLLQDSTTFYYNDIARNYADFLNELDETSLAIDMQKRILNRFLPTDSIEHALSYLSLSNYYLNLNQLDSAKYYSDISNSVRPASFGDDYDFALDNMYIIQNTVLEYALNKQMKIGEIALFSNDVLQGMNKKNKILLAKANNITQLKERNLRLQLQKRNDQMVLLLVIILFLVAIGAGYISVIRKRKMIEDREEELDTLHKLLKDSKQEDEFFKRILLQQLGVIKLAAATPKEQNIQFLQLMAKISNKDIPLDTLLVWEDLYQVIDSVYHDFYTKLYAKYGSILTEREIQLCCLLVADFSTKEISMVSQQSVRTIYQRKTTIRQKLQMDEKEDIVDFIIADC